MNKDKRTQLLQAVKRLVQAVILVMAWFAAVALAATIGAIGYGMIALVVGVTVLRALGHVVVPNRWTVGMVGRGWVAGWIVLDAVTLLGGGVLLIGGAFIAIAAMTSPVWWSALPGLLAVVAAVHAWSMVGGSASRWKPGASREEQAA